MRPLLMLCMIVKDEAAGIGRTLESVRGVIDAWTILDTGSTDGTQDVVRRALAGIPGNLHEAPFVDFATSRNQALDLAGTGCEFVLNLDAEDVIEDPAALRAFLEAAAPGTEAAFDVIGAMGEMALCTTRIARTTAGWRYRGAVHEVLIGPQGQIARERLPGAGLRHTRAPASQARSAERWRRDLDLLLSEVAREPGNTRATFYLAQTYRCLGRLPEAIAVYRRRAEMGGWHEEVYASVEIIARLSAELGLPWPDVQQLYLEAHALSPHRAEPLVAIARHYADEGAYPLAYLFARRAWELPYPAQDRLFVDVSVYEWKAADLVATSAYYVGALELGVKALRQAMAALPGNPGLLKTQAFYAAAGHL